jgi:hypothetical protein
MISATVTPPSLPASRAMSWPGVRRRHSEPKNGA